LLGMFTSFMSYSPGKSFYDPDSNTLYRTPGSLDAAGLASGLGMMAESQMTYAQEQARLNVAKAAFAKQTAEQYQGLQKKFADRRRQNAENIRRFGVERFRLPRTNATAQQEEVAEVLRQTKDYTTLGDLLTKRAQEERGSAKCDYPFLLVEIYSLKSQVPKT